MPMCMWVPRTIFIALAVGPWPAAEKQKAIEELRDIAKRVGSLPLRGLSISMTG